MALNPFKLTSEEEKILYVYIKTMRVIKKDRYLR